MIKQHGEVSGQDEDGNFLGTVFSCRDNTSDMSLHIVYLQEGMVKIMSDFVCSTNGPKPALHSQWEQNHQCSQDQDPCGWSVDRIQWIRGHVGTNQCYRANTREHLPVGKCRGPIRESISLWVSVGGQYKRAFPCG